MQFSTLFFALKRRLRKFYKKYVKESFFSWSIFMPHKAANLVTVRISESRLLHNFDAWFKLLSIADKPPMIAPVLKSNAYGHGLEIVAEILTENRADKIPFCVVDSHFEARTLRSRSTHLPILIVGYTEPRAIHYDTIPQCSYMVSSLEQLRDLLRYRIDRKGEPVRVFEPKPVSIHLKIDSGMNRQGIKPDQIYLLKDLFEVCVASGVKIHGLASHFADSDSYSATKTLEQIATWNAIVEELKPLLPDLTYIHISNTAGTYYANQATANVVRIGGGLFGLEQNSVIENKVTIKPVLSVYTKIYNIKDVKAGESIGYGMTYVADSAMRIGLIPLGYNECLPRSLSNCGSVRFGEIYAPIVGRVSMNITAIDLSLVSHYKVINEGTEVCVISGDDALDHNSITAIARHAKTLTYDIAVHISPLLKRERVN